MLKRRGLRHEVLNAKYHQREAEIVAGAGQRGAITIATNMAGRGTDIKLGQDLDLTTEEAGLQIIGTERHESRRIDRQLRGPLRPPGRSRRQSVFFLSLEDDLMRLFGSDRIATLMDRAGQRRARSSADALITRTIEQAQKRVELQNFQARKRLLEYDDVMNQQREVVYSLRLFALDKGEELKAEALPDDRGGAGAAAVRELPGDADRPQEFDRAGLRALAHCCSTWCQPEAVLDAAATPDLDRSWSRSAQAEGEASFHRKMEYLHDFGRTIGVPDVDEQVLSQVMLAVLDEKWKDHLYDLDQLRNAIQYRAYGQRDPLVEYKREAFEMFEDLMRDMQATFTERFLKIQVTAEPPRPPAAAARRRRPALARRRTTSSPAPPAAARAPAPAPAHRPSPSSAGPLRRAAAGRRGEVGRNDPCPCGSGKKYKKCHGAGQ